MDAGDTARAASSLLGKANKFERCYMFVLDKAHHVPESNTEIVRTKMFGKPLEMTRKGWYKTAVITSRLPSGYTLRVNMTSDMFLSPS